MNRRTYLLSLSAAALSSAAWAQHNHGDDSHGYVGPEPGSLGGTIALSDLAGRPFTDANFAGFWTLLYFGYANCRSACPTALPNLSDALTRLRSARVAAQADRSARRAHPASLTSGTGEHAQPPSFRDSGAVSVGGTV
jgi:cytochrome oxidase Cu insertion factor (SCO1/SenC/PrrC family)